MKTQNIGSCAKCGANLTSDHKCYATKEEYIEDVKREMTKLLEDGEPCFHPGCLNHVTHPCEMCGRIGGVRQK